MLQDMPQSPGPGASCLPWGKGPRGNGAGEHVCGGHGLRKLACGAPPGTRTRTGTHPAAQCPKAEEQSAGCEHERCGVCTEESGWVRSFSQHIFIECLSGAALGRGNNARNRRHKSRVPCKHAQPRAQYTTFLSGEGPVTVPKETECYEPGGATPPSGLGSRALGFPASRGHLSFRTGGSWGQVQAGTWGRLYLGVGAAVLGMFILSDAEALDQGSRWVQVPTIHETPGLRWDEEEVLAQGSVPPAGFSHSQALPSHLSNLIC